MKDLSRLTVKSSDIVEKIKLKVEEKLTNTIADIHSYWLVVLKTEGKITLNESGGWKEILNDINANDLNTINDVSEGERVANLGLSDGQILLVQIMPRTPHISTAPETFSDNLVHKAVRFWS